MARRHLSAADVTLYPATVMLMCLRKGAEYFFAVFAVCLSDMWRLYSLLCSNFSPTYFLPPPSRRCHIRVIDTFGTEPAYNHEEYATLHGFRTNWGYWNLHGQQYMTMFRKCRPSSPCSARTRACLECARQADCTSLLKPSGREKSRFFGAQTDQRMSPQQLRVCRCCSEPPAVTSHRRAARTHRRRSRRYGEQKKCVLFVLVFT